MPEKSVHIPVSFVVCYHCMSRCVYGNVGRVPHVGLTCSVSLVLPGLFESALHFQCFSYFEAIQKHLVQVTLTLLMLLRYTTYRAINNHFFMLDFCYFMQISVITQTLLFPPTSAFGAAWFKANFALRSDLFWFCLVSFTNANTG